MEKPIYLTHDPMTAFEIILLGQSPGIGHRIVEGIKGLEQLLRISDEDIARERPVMSAVDILHAL